MVKIDIHPVKINAIAQNKGLKRKMRPLNKYLCNVYRGDGLYIDSPFVDSQSRRCATAPMSV